MESSLQGPGRVLCRLPSRNGLSPYRARWLSHSVLRLVTGTHATRSLSLSVTSTFQAPVLTSGRHVVGRAVAVCELYPL